MPRDRRRFLQGCGIAVLGGLAGCSGSDGTDGRGPPLTQTAKLFADDGNRDDNFGTTVALSADGTTAVVGAPSKHEPNGKHSGSAYVFERTDGSWRQVAQLTPDDGAPQHRFGGAVSVDRTGSLVLVGAYRYEEQGGVYVYEDNDGGWERTDTLVPDAIGSQFPLFGFALDVTPDGSAAIVGAKFEPVDGWAHAGAAYRFTRSAGSWDLQNRFIAPFPRRDGSFGRAVSIADDGATVAVGTLEESVHVFRHADGSWNESTLTIDDREDRDFGNAVALAGNGDTVVVGAHRSQGTEESGGSAFVFQRSDGDWNRRAEFTPGQAGVIDFGTSVAVAADGEAVLVGSVHERAFLHTKSGESWERTGTLAPDDADADNQFGEAVALSGDASYALIGAIVDDELAEDAGAAYVFEETDAE